MRKRTALTAIILILLFAFTAAAVAENSIVSVTGYSHVNVQYWQVDVLALEYAQDVTLPQGTPD